MKYIEFEEIQRKVYEFTKTDDISMLITVPTSTNARSLALRLKNVAYFCDLIITHRGNQVHVEKIDWYD